MSQQSINKFLKNFQKKLDERSKVYRRKNANKESQIFVLSKKAIQRGIKDSIKKAYGIPITPTSKLPESFKMVLQDLEPKINQSITNIKTVIKFYKTNNSKTKGDGVIVRELKSKQYEGVYVFIASERAKSKRVDVFNRVFQTYIDELEYLAKKVAETLNDIEKSKGPSKINFGSQAKNYWQLEHSKEEGVAETQLADALDFAFNNANFPPGVSKQDVVALLASVGIQLTFIRDTKLRRMRIFIGSKASNELEGGIIGKEKRDLLTDLRNLGKEEKQQLYTLSGSDSFRDIDKKTLIKNATQPFKKLKNAKVKTKNTKIKHSKKTATLDKKPKNTISSSKQKPVKSRQALNRKPSSSLPDLRMLIGVLNQQLPRTVAKNMEDPRLNYRTGRFASSVKVTDIITTKKGFPSVGYTYDKYPYQTFEPGYRQGSVERDPRRLIDVSIREIAVQFAIGRFYTRRV